MPDLICAIDLHVGLPDGLDLVHQRFMAFGTGAKQLGLAFAGGMAPVARRGDLQHGLPTVQ